MAMMNPITLFLLTIMGSEPDAEPTEPAQELKRSVALGRPTDLEPGANHGVWIWRTGDRWHVRTTTKNAKHGFTGVVSVPSGSEIERISTTKTDLADRIELRERAIRFDFTTQGHEDGFDFTVGGKGCVRFAVEVDGEHAPQMIKLGKRSVRPDSWHFKLCS
jgi:hypothetical protein